MPFQRCVDFGDEEKQPRSRVEQIDRGMDLAEVWSVFTLVLPTPQHKLVNFVWCSIRRRHTVTRIDQLSSSSIRHSLVGSSSFAEYFPGKHTIAPDIAQRCVLAVV